MTKEMICIECPKGCVLSVDIEDNKAAKVSGAKCPKGIMHAAAELDNPVRIFTSTVLARGLSMKLVPVRTDKPIPKRDLFKAVDEVRKMRIAKPVNAGDAIVNNFLGLGVKLMATRKVD